MPALMKRHSMTRLFLVRWPNGDLEMVAARDELELVATLDLQDDPYSAAWRAFDAPLWIGLTWESPTDEPRLGMMRRAENDDTRNMEDEVLRLAFPRLHKLYEQECEDAAQLLAACEADRAAFPPAEWHTMASRGIVVDAGAWRGSYKNERSTP